jgi:hypothetical protein
MGSRPVPSAACPPHDPFCRCFARRLQIGAEERYRQGLARRFSYVLPESHLLEVVRRHSPLVELGAGTGYWTYLLRLMGADVVAYDSAPIGGLRENRYHPDVPPWTDVLLGDLPVLTGHSDRCLFLCWPPIYSALWEALGFYAGEWVIYIGDHGGRAARLAGLDDAFLRVELHPAVAMEPDPRRPAELSVWRRRRRRPTAI